MTSSFASFFMIVALSSIALPGTNGFVGEFLILLGTFRANYVYGILGATGVVLAAAYMLWMFQRVMFGAIKHSENRELKDLNLREIMTLVPIVIMVIWMGVFPKFFLKKMDLSVQHFLYDVKARYAAATTSSTGEGRVSATKGTEGSKAKLLIIKEQ